MSNDTNRVQYGVFLPSGRNGHIPSAGVPQMDPTFEQNLRLTKMAEDFGMEFVIAMVKYRGPGGETGFWDVNLDSFTLAAGLLARTSRIKVFPSAGLLSLNPAVTAKMIATLDSIAPGRVGLNIVTGWNPMEYSQMGMWPGDEYFSYRYEYAAEYVQILRDLWNKGVSDFRGKYFRFEDCNGRPQPSGPIDVVCAATSSKGREFVAAYAEQNLLNVGFAPVSEAAGEIAERAERHGRPVSANAQVTIVLADSDAEAIERVAYINETTDQSAFADRRKQGARDAGNSGTGAWFASSVQALEEGAYIAGGPATVAERLREVESTPGVGQINLIFDDYDDGLPRFGREVLPLLRPVDPVSVGLAQASMS